MKKIMDQQKQFIIDQPVDDYLITLHNITERGLGLRIKAGANIDPDSAAILSVADMHNDNKFIVKSNGNVVSYYNHMIGNILIEENTIDNIKDKPIDFKVPVTLSRYNKSDLPKLANPGSIIAIEDEKSKPAYYDGDCWRYFSNDEKVD